MNTTTDVGSRQTQAEYAETIAATEARVDVRLPMLFELHRAADPTGVSGEGLVATGVTWPDQAGAVYRWSSPTPPPGYFRPVHQIGTFDSIGEIMAVHGHLGATELRLFPAIAGAALVEAFAFLNAAGGVQAWGAWWPADGRTVTYRPARIAYNRDETVRGECVERWRSLADAQREYAGAPYHAGLALLTTTRGLELAAAISRA